MLQSYRFILLSSIISILDMSCDSQYKIYFLLKCHCQFLLKLLDVLHNPEFTFNSKRIQVEKSWILHSIRSHYSYTHHFIMSSVDVISVLQMKCHTMQSLFCFQFQFYAHRQRWITRVFQLIHKCLVLRVAINHLKNTWKPLQCYLLR